MHPKYLALISAAMALAPSAALARRGGSWKFFRAPTDISDPMMTLLIIAGACFLLAALIKIFRRVIDPASVLQTGLRRLNMAATFVFLCCVGLFIFEAAQTGPDTAEQQAAASNVRFTGANADGAKFIKVGE